jgi:hypothetical protein
MSINDWINSKKSISCRFISNVDINWPKYLQREWIDVELNKDYSINVINRKWDVSKYCLIHTAFGTYSPNFVFKLWKK